MTRYHRTRRLGAIEHDILIELTGADLLYGFLLSARSTRRMFKLAQERATERYRRKQAIERLIRGNYIRVKGGSLTITSVGEAALEVAIHKNRAKLGSKVWDHRWRIAAFDIPEKLAPLRRTVRTALKKAGFLQLQQSIWIFPHECEDLVRLIKEDPRLANYLLYGVLIRIENEDRLKKLFHL